MIFFMYLFEILRCNNTRKNRIKSLGRFISCFSCVENNESIFLTSHENKELNSINSAGKIDLQVSNDIKVEKQQKIKNSVSIDHLKQFFLNVDENILTNLALSLEQVSLSQEKICWYLVIVKYLTCNFTTSQIISVDEKERRGILMLDYTNIEKMYENVYKKQFKQVLNQEIFIDSIIKNNYNSYDVNLYKCFFIHFNNLIEDSETAQEALKMISGEEATEHFNLEMTRLYEIIKK